MLAFFLHERLWLFYTKAVCSRRHLLTDSKNGGVEGPRFFSFLAGRGEPF